MYVFLGGDMDELKRLAAALLAFTSQGGRVGEFPGLKDLVYLMEVHKVTLGPDGLREDHQEGQAWGWNYTPSLAPYSDWGLESEFWLKAHAAQLREFGRK